MSEAIKSISLDDIGGLQGQGKDAPKPANVMYNPQYGGGDQFQSSTSASSDLGNQASGAQGLSSVQDSAFGTSLTRMTELFGKFDNTTNTRTYILAGVLVVALAAALYLTSGDGTQSPISSILSQFDSMMGHTPEAPADDLGPEAAPTTAATTHEVAPAAPRVATPPLAQPSVLTKPTELVNPYWSLPNPLDIASTPPGQGVLNPSQEERWRQGLAHPFVWQRFKTVTDMRGSRIKGSQYLLNDALAQPKFWTRMESLLALAEMGEPVDIDTVEAALTSTRRSLIQNYFRRFHKATSGGELYIIRQAIRVVDAGTRKVILESLIRQRNPINELYLVAATYDPNARINSWVSQEVAGKPLSENAKERFRQITAGVDMTPPTPGTTAAPAAGSKVQDLKVEELTNDVNVEEVYFLKDDEKVERKVPPAEDGFQQLERK